LARGDQFSGTRLLSRRTGIWLTIGILAVAGLWRAVIAITIPCISRDSVTFCEYARELGQTGIAYLRQPTTQQHPLLPICVLAGQRTARLCGAPGRGQRAQSPRRNRPERSIFCSCARPQSPPH